ncbi:MAG: quinolinate synthase NadA [Candidatus Diapherotrites archaeon]|nr:quinolinate synthase NadA [Candidatus Diapherotrites archaeon]
MDGINEILALKRDLNAVFLVHNYQPPEVQDLADFCGDSLELCRHAQETDADYILFCGVDFMAECAAILNPDKKVLLPDREARCPMAGMLPAEEVRKAREEHPDAAVVLYINTLAEAKAEADLVCTSANPVEMVDALKERTVLFGPDKNLAWFAQKHTRKKIVRVPDDGYCYTHHLRLLRKDVEALKAAHPNAVVLAHPECNPDVQEIADRVLGTGGMMHAAHELRAREFIVATEKDMCYRLKKAHPHKEFYPVESAVCDQMKKHTPFKIHEALSSPEPVRVERHIAKKALRPIQRMLELSE